MAYEFPAMPAPVAPWHGLQNPMRPSVRRRQHRNGLRSYSTIGRAQSYARQLATRFPGAEFVVILSPFASYAFRWLIKVQRGNGRICGGAYVGW